MSKMNQKTNNFSSYLSLLLSLLTKGRTLVETSHEMIEHSQHALHYKRNVVMTNAASLADSYI